MQQVLIYNILLIAGLLCSQNLEEIFSFIAQWGIVIPSEKIFYSFLMICLSYIMIEVGIEFTADKESKREYIHDYFVAALTAACPWLLCTAYFCFVCRAPFQESLFLARFASPTSSGILFPFLASARLTKSWFYRKAYIHTIFDDLDSVLFMIPLYIAIIGFRPAIFCALLWIGFCLFLACRFLHSLRIPIHSFALLSYSILIWLATFILESLLSIQFEALLPAFCLGCMIKKPNRQEDLIVHEKTYSHFDLEKCIKSLFMFVVGISLPQLSFEAFSLKKTLLHVLAITFFSNLGKCVPLLFYRKEADIKERMALSIAMFPRGEMGAGILAISMAHRGSLHISQIAGLTLALNFIMTGVFISMIKSLLRDKSTF